MYFLAQGVPRNNKSIITIFFLLIKALKWYKKVRTCLNRIQKNYKEEGLEKGNPVLSLKSKTSKNKGGSFHHWVVKLGKPCPFLAQASATWFPSLGMCVHIVFKHFTILLQLFHWFLICHRTLSSLLKGANKL